MSTYDVRRGTKDINKTEARKQSLKRLYRGLIVAGALTLGACGTIGKEAVERKEATRVEQAAKIDVVRSFKNIDKNKKGQHSLPAHPLSGILLLQPFPVPAHPVPVLLRPDLFAAFRAVFGAAGIV